MSEMRGGEKFGAKEWGKGGKRGMRRGRGITPADQGMFRSRVSHMARAVTCDL